MFASIRRFIKQRVEVNNAPLLETPEGSDTPVTETVAERTEEPKARTVVDQIIPYDEHLLERTRNQWRQGDWESLVRLDMNSIAHHPDRAKLGLLVASAWLQQGESAAAQHYLRHAIDWGCDKKLAAQILTAGVHNTLGRAAAIANDKPRMEHHFRQALVGSGGQCERASLTRQHVELHRLGLEQTGWNITPAVPDALKAQEIPITYPPHGITSYAQNFEDVMLWRALWNVENGFYIDVGAHHPINDSVSKAFYEKGWRGIHIEPQGELAEKLRQDRPDEDVLELCLNNFEGSLVFYKIMPGGELSTISKELAQTHLVDIHEIESVTEITVSAVTLDNILDRYSNRQIHWLKLDIEGAEFGALEGWCNSFARPWVLVIESTIPGSLIDNSILWQPLVICKGYHFAYFDGLNKYYIHETHLELVDRFAVPPNIFDKYTTYKKQ